MDITTWHAHGKVPIYNGWKWAWPSDGYVCVCERTKDEDTEIPPGQRAKMDEMIPLFDEPGVKVPLSDIRAWLTEVLPQAPEGGHAYVQFGGCAYRADVLAKAVSLFDDLDIRVTVAQRMQACRYGGEQATGLVTAFRSKSRVAIAAPLNVTIATPPFLLT